MKKLISLFKQIVQIDSPTGKEKEMADFVVNFLTPYASYIKKDNYGNIYARIDGKKENIFLSAHLDTVEPGRGIKPQIKNQYITSDGNTILGADNKAAVACFLYLFLFLKKNKIQHKTIETIFTLSEEINNYGALNFDYSLLRAKKGYCFDSSNPVGTIIIASPFYERFDLEIIGKEAHAAKPKEAINVLLIFKDLLQKIKLGFLDKETIMNIGIINGGYVRNTIPGRLTLKGELRSLSEKKLLFQKKIFLEKLKKTIKKYQGNYKINFVLENTGYKHSLNLAFLKETIKKIKSINLKPNLITSWGVSDANIFNEKGVKCINLADGSEFSHTTKERIKIFEMENLFKLIFALTKI